MEVKMTRKEFQLCDEIHALLEQSNCDSNSCIKALTVAIAGILANPKFDKAQLGAFVKQAYINLEQTTISMYNDTLTISVVNPKIY